jgi:tryptophanyl-tRNA synthetase
VAPEARRCRESRALPGIDGRSKMSKSARPNGDLSLRRPRTVVSPGPGHADV